MAKRPQKLGQRLDIPTPKTAPVPMGNRRFLVSVENMLPAEEIAAADADAATAQYMALFGIRELTGSRRFTVTELRDDVSGTTESATDGDPG
jgi:hypothetical protein